jgi:spermidine synthase
MTRTEASSREESSQPWGVLVDTANIPGGGRLHLYRHDEEYEILFGEEQLMGSWAYRSEEALATLVSDRLGGQAERVLIGGLGMGFTLAAALAAFAPPTTIVVAELVPQVVAWARGPLADIVGNSLTNPRVTIQIADIHDIIVAADGDYDAILLDVDNGPDGLIHLANERLYCNWGLRAAYSALRPGGVLAVWSAYPDEGFGERLREAGFNVEILAVHSGGREAEPPHVIWLAAKASSSPQAGALIVSSDRC